MNNLFKYIKKYGDLTFEEKKITDIDILIFSQISYLDYSDVFVNNDEEIKLSILWENVREKNTKIKGYAPKKAFKLMEALSNKNRYKDLILKNYVYHLEDDTQFGAITIVVPNDYIYVSFEGTDNTISGWKEDFKLLYTYPTKSQKLATQYLNNTIKFSGPDVIVCGHSKGGNLALVGAMNTNILKKIKIKKIYSYDGPGLKDEEFRSLNYILVKNKLVNIVPSACLVGMFLNQENIIVVKGRGIGVLQHAVTSWVIDDDKFVYTKLDKLSKKLDICLSKWIEKYNYEEREKIVETVFGVFDKANIKKLSDIKINNLYNIYKIIKNSKDIPSETKEIIRTSLKLLVGDFKTEVIKGLIAKK